MATNTRADFTVMASGRTVESKLTDVINASDYGATSGGTAGANTTAINLAIVAASAHTGFVMVDQDVSYTEASLTIPDDVIVLIATSNGTLTILAKNQGTSLPITKGGLVIKGQGNTGVLLRNTDYGVTAEPFLQFIDATNGDLAAVEFKFAELTEISDPVAPSANKARLYLKDNGAGKTQLVVRFPTGAVQQLAIEP